MDRLLDRFAVELQLLGYCSILALFVCALGALLYLFTRFGVWQALEKHYSTDEEPKGTVWRWRGSRWDRCDVGGFIIRVKFTTNSMGMFIEAERFLCFGYPRLFIPWCE